MAKFNLSKKATKPYTKQLEDNRKDNNNEAIVEGINFNKILDDDRNENEGDKNYEKMQEEVHKESANQVTEKQLNSEESKWTPLRSDDGKHPMDYYEETEKENVKDFEEAQDKIDKDTSFWDDYVGEQLDGEPTKQPANNAPSQLLSKYEDRDKFNKENPDIKKVAAKIDNLATADAMIYHIYAAAAREGRDFNNLKTDERNLLDDINIAKAKIMLSNK